jgi:tRNA(adenine34) deaminase
VVDSTHGLGLWDALPEPWQECVRLAWGAYCAGSLPIGAVVTDTEGNILSRGRNRIHERAGDDGVLFGSKLAHAEMNALLALDANRCEPGSCILYTTTEPCPLCVGAVRMSDVKNLRYASREPWGGCALSFEMVPYLKRGNVRVSGPEDGRLEAVLIALKVERYLYLKPRVLEPFLEVYESMTPEAVFAGRRLYRSGVLERLRHKKAPVPEAVEILLGEIEEERGA